MQRFALGMKFEGHRQVQRSPHGIGLKSPLLELHSPHGIGLKSPLLMLHSPHEMVAW